MERRGERIASGFNGRFSEEVISSVSTDRIEEPPYRICLTGGWLDQPWLSRIHPGAVIVLNVHPDFNFALRSGMATSTRSAAFRINSSFLGTDFLDEARRLFHEENSAGSKYVSGSQDALGLCLPGLNKLSYAGEYWPESIESMSDSSAIDWLASVLWLVPIGPRPPEYDPLKSRNMDKGAVCRLAWSSEAFWNAVIRRDVAKAGESLSETLESWRYMLPDTVPSHLNKYFGEYRLKCAGFSITGCGGGYLMMISEGRPSREAFQVRPRVL